MSDDDGIDDDGNDACGWALPGVPNVQVQIPPFRINLLLCMASIKEGRGVGKSRMESVRGETIRTEIKENGRWYAWVKER